MCCIGDAVVTDLVVADEQVERDYEEEVVLDPVDRDLEGQVQALGDREEDGRERSVQVVQHQPVDLHVDAVFAGRTCKQVQLQPVGSQSNDKVPLNGQYDHGGITKHSDGRVQSPLPSVVLSDRETCF